jgi:hypothetical protein
MQNLERLSEYHRAYMLYCWADSTADPPHSLTWRFAITRVPCRERRQGLASLSDLISFLQNELDRAQEINAGRYEAERKNGEHSDNPVLRNSAGEVI